MKAILSKEGYKLHRNILIEDFKAIYFYIPKNGCTSFKKHIFGLIGDKNYKGTVHKYGFPFSTSQQLKFEYKDYMKFTLVRNPWSRLVSCYKSKIRSSDFTNDYFKNGIHRGFNRFKGLFYGDMPFREFAEAVCSIPDSNSDPHFISQLFWLADNSGGFRPNYIGRLEDPGPTFEDVFDKTGLSFSAMKTLNQSNYDTSYRSFYDEELKEKIRHRYAGDIEIFGYEFESSPAIKQIGFVDDTLQNKLAQSGFVIPILEEKYAYWKFKYEKETNPNLQRNLHQNLTETSQNLSRLQNQLDSESKFSDLFGLKKFFSKNQ